MATKKPTNRSASDEGGHVPHPRSDDAHYEATEPERIREIERTSPAPRDEDEFVTDAELEAREIDRESDEG
jgi:hypothetical protein